MGDKHSALTRPRGLIKRGQRVLSDRPQPRRRYTVDSVTSSEDRRY